METAKVFGGLEGTDALQLWTITPNPKTRKP